VKECNRIDAMRTQLAKFGVKTAELEDGIEVFGINPNELKSGVSVHCYDDHRVAMAFSVLASCPGGAGAIIEEKRCVEKTWPSWWDDLSNRIGITLEGVELDHSSALSKDLPQLPRHSTDASIFILGMRGAGKTHISKVGASALGWPVIDADGLFETMLGITAKAFVEKNGWPAFRAQETSILRDLISTKATGHIISLGGGVIEAQENRGILIEYAAGGGPIVHVIRDIDDILAYLNSEPTRPSLGEPLTETYARRLPWYHQLSNFEFVNVVPASSVSLKGCEDEIARFFKFITGVDTNHVDLSSDRSTSFLSLTFPSLTVPHPSLDDHFDELTAGVDALELRADLLSPDNISPTSPTTPSIAFVAQQLAALRQRSTLPIVFTVRTQSQGGQFTDDAEDAAFELMELAVKSGCEYIDLEARWNPKRMQAFVEAKQSSKIICSWHDWSGKLKWDGDEVRARYQMASQYGDIVKIVSKATSIQDNMAMMKFREEMMKNGKPLMTMNMGVEGQLSRILSPVFCPLTSPLLPSRAAPGQLSFAEVQTGLHLIGQLPAKKFYLFGSPIAHSKSPLLHNTGFTQLGLPHHYSTFETITVDDSIKSVIRSPDFGGASVTVPHKLDIMPLLDEISTHAQLIGAVNTIIPIVRNGETTLLGDNTDWLGIKELINNNLSTSNEVSEGSTALVIGAGGTSRAAVYSLHNVGFKTIYLYNRTRANADSMVASFPSDYNIIVLTSLDSLPTSAELPVVIISAIAAAGTSTVHQSNPDAGVAIPSSILGRTQGGVVIDMAYKPKITPLIELAQKTNGWKAVPGVEMLLEQGYHQFKFWTGRRAPKHVIETTVLRAYERDL
jgi:pentafunctional AROM polypeptide